MYLNENFLDIKLFLCEKILQVYMLSHSFQPNEVHNYIMFYIAFYLTIYLICIFCLNFFIILINIHLSSNSLSNNSFSFLSAWEWRGTIKIPLLIAYLIVHWTYIYIYEEYIYIYNLFYIMLKCIGFHQLHWYRNNCLLMLSKQQIEKLKFMYLKQ